MSMPIGDERTPYYLELISRLDETQRDILTSLRDRRPGLAMDIAVRVLRFPDEIGRPLRTRQEMNLVRARPFAGGQMGAELFSLPPKGEQVVRLCCATPTHACTYCGALRAGCRSRPLRTSL